MMGDNRHVTPYNSRVVVLGAGVAGLSAAAHLVRNGFKNVTVLEAMDRSVRSDFIKNIIVC